MPSAAGGPSDLIGRKLTQLMGDKAGQPFVVDNRPGANGVIGVQAFLRTPPDGNTLMFTTTSTTATNKAMIKDLPYDPTKDPVPLAFGFRTWMMVAVSSKLPFKTVHELVAYAKSSPGKLNFGYGTANPQLGGKLFEQLTGTRFTFVSYKSHSAMMLALTSGEVDLTVTDAMSLGAFIKAGSVRALASLSPARLAAMPELPTMSDVGLPSEEMLSAHLFMVRAGTPPGCACTTDGVDHVMRPIKGIHRLDSLHWLRQLPRHWYGGCAREPCRDRANRRCCSQVGPCSRLTTLCSGGAGHGRQAATCRRHAQRRQSI